MGSGNRAGFTLVELMVTASILTVMVFLVTTLSIAGSRAQQYSARLTRATEINQDILDGMRMELVSSVTLFSDEPPLPLGASTSVATQTPISLPRLSGTSRRDPGTTGRANSPSSR